MEKNLFTEDSEKTTVVTAIAFACKEIDNNFLHDVMELIQSNPIKYGGDYAKVLIAGLQTAVDEKMDVN